MPVKKITAQIQKNFLIVLLTVLLSAQSLFAAEQVFFYHTDPAGTPLAMTDSTGKVVWKADYKPFGEEQSVTATTNNDRRFVGKEKDTETGLSYFGARYQDARTGRFISPDPIRAVDPKTSKTNEYLLLNPQRLKTYAYGLNNPYRYVDPDGKFVFLIPAVIAGAEYTGAMMLGDATFAYLAGKFAQQIYKDSGGEQPSYKTKESACPKAADAPGQTASGHPTDEYGNKLGPSGEPMVHGQKHPTRKGAKDAARQEGKGAPVNHPTPVEGDRHFHPTNQAGNKMPGSTHHEY